MKKLLLILITPLCWACAVGPDYKMNKIYSDEVITNELNLKKNSDNKIRADWFKLFNDNYLNELIDTGLKNSPNILIAKEKLLQARYNLYMAKADLLPDFDINLDYSKISPSQSVEPNAKQDYFQLGFDASWEIDIWGGKRRLIESQRALLNSVSADFDNVKSVLISEIVSNYINWRVFQTLVKETLTSIDYQTKIYETMKSKYEAGLVDDLDFKQAESLLKSTKQNLPQYIINEKKSLNSLSVLVGNLPSKTGKNNNEISDISFDVNSLFDLPANIILLRPDVVAAEQNLVAQNALIGNKISKLLPSLSLKTFLGFQNSTLAPIFGKNYNMYSNTIESVMPILHWGQIINDIKYQEAATREAFDVYKRSVLQGIADVSLAITSVEENLKNYNLANENALLYQNIADLSKQKYDSGLIAFDNYLDAEKNKISAVVEKYQTLGNMLVSIASFYKAVGGGVNTNYSAPDDQTACSK